MRRINSASYFDTTFPGSRRDNFDSRHLVYTVVQLHFNLTLDTTSLVSRDSHILGAGDI